MSTQAIVQATAPQPPIQAQPRPFVPCSWSADLVGLPGCPKLTEALSQARDRCKAAILDAYNDHHKFAYASADEVVRTAQEAMQGSGLALIPVHEELLIKGPAGAVWYALDSYWMLSHSSGEFLPITICGWPVLPEKGRPLDKAFATAITTALAFKLRGLLQMPRGTDSDASARDDTQMHPSAQPTPVQSPAPVAPVAPNGQATQALSTQPGSITTAQSDAIAGMVSPEKAAQFNTWIQQTHHVGRIRDLSENQAAAVLAGMQAQKAKAAEQALLDAPRR